MQIAKRKLRRTSNLQFSIFNSQFSILPLPRSKVFIHSGTCMFERYTEKARRVIFFARYEASQFGAEAIQSEHILLGLLREDKQLTQKFFRSPHSTVESIRREIESRTALRDKVSASVDLPLSSSAKRVLSYAADESDWAAGARRAGSDEIAGLAMRATREV